MAQIVIDSLRHSYDGNLSDPGALALKQVDLTWEDGRAYALLGPSGCGKSSMLNIISGLVRQSTGRILFDGTDVSDLPTEKRNIAQVFQFPVLYDTMTVEQNLAFPLKNRRLPTDEIRRRVADVAEMLDLGPLLKKRASGLGAAEKQKISLGRGLVRSDVAAVLFDEPLTVIDPHVKFELRRKLKLLHEELGLTLIYVTHDQSEALTLADEVVVMAEGEVMQAGTPEQLYERPSHTFVGNFIGSPGMNFIPCRAEGERLVFSGGSLPLPPALSRSISSGQSLKIGIRPQHLRLDTSGTPQIAAHLIELQPRGDSYVADLRIGETALAMRVPDDVALPAAPFGVSFPPKHTLLYADDSLIGDLDA
ncbi:ATP-binding cassette domain-containing protein [Pseudooceanicola sp. 216_PA32_1]|uniref:ATP-binding cassette domain-containing protein n=1 Tax=Pseudooceanicola pacificus TaxID=2676438 RepID=A0A844WFF0_9RHOB|nr:ABC transporter ATP-binding protein [Pseudooceanicola pacificus]MWB79120.1 ATP-binding cassette domain-containing protein [Pseudooceanicola pacificus]